MSTFSHLDAAAEFTNHVAGSGANPSSRNVVHSVEKCFLSTYCVSEPTLARVQLEEDPSLTVLAS